MPNSPRNGKEEYKAKRIKNARFFDLGECRDKASEYPHMLPNPNMFSNYMNKLNISNTDHVVVYDASGIFSSCRIFWTLKVFGHEKVSLLNGGLPRWLNEGYNNDTTNIEYNNGFNSYPIPSINRDLIKDYNQINELIRSNNSYNILDARPKDRFDGKVPEPRAGLNSGHMPNSINLPFGELLTNQRFKDKTQLNELFNHLNMKKDLPIITSCGSGVTACILYFGLKYARFYNEDETPQSINDHMISVYDGSWSEYAARK
ncbi:Rhodanese-like protein, partial [Neoconidiobolus thromboides FSU 785]